MEIVLVNYILATAIWIYSGDYLPLGKDKGNHYRVGGFYM
jgi:hypothetical protein